MFSCGYQREQFSGKGIALTKTLYKNTCNVSKDLVWLEWRGPREEK